MSSEELSIFKPVTAKAHDILSRPGLLAFSIVLAIGLIRIGLIFSQPAAHYITFVGDDSFYYQRLAQNFAKLGRWTFDGTAPASGFHLLWAYLSAGLWWLWPAMSPLVDILVLSLLSAVLVALAASVLARTLTPLLGRLAAIGILIPFISVCGIQIPTLMMEAPFVLLFASLTFRLTLAQEPKTDWTALIAAAAVGFLGMMSRSDFGLVPFGLFAAFVLMTLLKRLPLALPRLRIAGFCLFGSVVGLAVVFLHNYLISGSFLQSSARMKVFWSHNWGYSPGPALTMLAKSVVPSVIYIDDKFWIRIVFVIAGLAATYPLFRRLTARKEQSLVQAAILASLIIILGYIGLYTFDDNGVQPWYAASFMCPMAVFAAVIITSLPSRWAPFQVATVTSLLLASVVLSLRPVWPQQAASLIVGRYLKDHPNIRPVGAWNAGIVAIYSGRQVINLDGLVNDDIYPYAKSGTLIRYFALRRIKYVVDSPFMFGEHKSRNGGYADGKLKSCMVSSKPLVPVKPAYLWHNTVEHLMVFNLACIDRFAAAEAQLSARQKN